MRRDGDSDTARHVRAWRSVAAVPVPGVEPIPLNPQLPGCSAAVTVNQGQARECFGEPTHAAVWTVPHTGTSWRVFLCDLPAHRDAVPCARPLTKADREALALRKERWADAIAGRGWIPPKPLR